MPVPKAMRQRFGWHCQRKNNSLPKRKFGIQPPLVSLGFFESDKANLHRFKYSEFSSDSAQFTTITELAEHENLALTYMTRVLRLTLLALEIVVAILDGRQGPEMPLGVLLEPFPLEWEGQRKPNLISPE